VILRFAVATSGLLLLLPVLVAAQGAPPPRVDLVRYVQTSYAAIKGQLQAAASAMPDADYAFKPTAMSEARTFAAVIAHAADGMFGTCARVRGVPNPNPDVERRQSAKVEVITALAESIVFCDAAYASLSEATAGDFVPQGPVMVTRAAALMGLLAHNAEMFGISTVYLRAKNIVPPGSR
jgi:hypothetical protein